MMTWTHAALDHWFAPKLSEFRSCEISSREDLAKQSQFWPSDMALFSVFRTVNNQNWRRSGYAFLRRASAAVNFYEQARLLTQEFLAKTTPQAPALTVYARAVDNWEVFLANAEQAMQLLSDSAGGLQRFVPGDGSDLERLNLLYNYSKHFAKRTKDGNSAAEAAFPIWISNEGLQCPESSLGWAEAVGMLDFFKQVVDRVFQELRDAKPGKASP